MNKSTIIKTDKSFTQTVENTETGQSSSVYQGQVGTDTKGRPVYGIEMTVTGQDEKRKKK